MRLVLLDGSAVTSMADIHRMLAQQLDFPDWYGANLDALHDCLTDLHEETVIIVFHREKLEEILGPAYGRLCRVLADCAGENPYLSVQF